MKKVTLILIFILTVKFTFSQTEVYHPLPDSNAVWVEEFSYLYGYYWKYDNYNLYIFGDTIIGGYNYHKLYKNGYVTQSYSSPEIPGLSDNYYGQYWGVFRQDITNKKIYLNDNGNDTLAYDFNLNVGDSLPLTFLYDSGCIVDSIDSVLVGGQYNKRFWVSDPSLWINASIIEGVGNSFGVFSPITVYFECNSIFWCLQVNNETVYNVNPNHPCTVINGIEKKTIQNQISINPNPFAKTSIIHINKNLSDATLKVYNTLGKEMKCINNITGQEIIFQGDNLPIGVYFIHLTQKNVIIATSKIIIMN